MDRRNDRSRSSERSRPHGWSRVKQHSTRPTRHTPAPREDFTTTSDPSGVNRLDMNDKVEKIVAELSPVQFDDWISFRPNVSTLSSTQQERNIADSLNAKSIKSEKLYHGTSGIRTPHIHSLQHTLVAQVQDKKILLNSAADKPTIDLIPSHTTFADGVRTWFHRGLGSIELPIRTPSLIRTAHYHERAHGGTAAFTMHAADARIPTHLFFSRHNSVLLSTTYKDQEELAIQDDTIPSDKIQGTRNNQPLLPPLLTVTCSGRSPKSMEAEERKSSSSITALHATETAVNTLFNPMKPIPFEAGLLAFEDSEMEEENIAQLKLAGGMLPNVNSTRPVNSGRVMPLRKDATPLPIWVQASKIEAKTGLPSQGGEYLIFPSVHHRTQDGGRPCSKSEGAICAHLTYMPISAILSGLLNLARTGALPISMLRSLNECRRKGLFLTIETAELHKDESSSDEEENEDDEDSF